MKKNLMIALIELNKLIWAEGYSEKEAMNIIVKKYKVVYNDLWEEYEKILN